VIEGFLAPQGATAYLLHATHGDSLLLRGHAGLPGPCLERFTMVPTGRRLPFTRALTTGEDAWLSRPELIDRYPLATALAQGSAISASFSCHVTRYGGIPTGTLVLGYRSENPRTWELQVRLSSLLHLLGLSLLGLSADSPRQRARSWPEGAVTEGVSERQREIMALVSEGLTNARISEVLGVSVATVKAELVQLFDLLGTRRRADLPARAIRAGM
jgi:DNA-binding CsgD family transcriptional regulator